MFDPNEVKETARRLRAQAAEGRRISGGKNPSSPVLDEAANQLEALSELPERLEGFDAVEAMAKLRHARSRGHLYEPGEWEKLPGATRDHLRNESAPLLRAALSSVLGEGE